MPKPVIICVDDEITILERLKVELKIVSEGQYIVELAESGEDALELIEELLKDNHEIPLVISDYIMPQMKGDELLQRIHSMMPKTLKIMLTGQATLEAVTHAINYAKLYRYIAKPWEPQDLKLTIKEALRSYYQEKKLEEQTIVLMEMNEDLSALNDAYERFVPKQFLELLGKENIVDIQLGDQVEKEMTLLFSDIREFTSLSENMTPQENFNFINAYLSQMEPIIHKHQGFIDKYIGDAIMALFPNNADDALQAAIGMLKSLADYNKTQNYLKQPSLKIGIGIHTGQLMLGTVGGQDRMDGTVISDAVNLASRIEGMTKRYNVTLLISEQTYANLIDVSQYAIRTIDRVKVKGKSTPVTVYEVFDSDSSNLIELKMKTRDIFEQGLAYYRQKAFTEAIVYFKQILQFHRNDKATHIYIQRCERFIKYGVPEDWEGVETLKTK